MKPRTIIIVSLAVVLVAVVVVIYSGGNGLNRDDLANTLESSKADSQDRQDAANKMARFHDDQAVALLGKYSRDNDAQVAQRALLSLGRIGDERSLQYIRPAMTAPRPELREAAAIAMGRVEPKLADTNTLKNMMASDQSPAVQAAAAKALGQLEDFSSIPQLVQALRDPELLVRGHAIGAIRRILGLRFGYEANDPPAKREEALRRIEDYVRRAR